MADNDDGEIGWRVINAIPAIVFMASQAAWLNTEIATQQFSLAASTTAQAKPAFECLRYPGELGDQHRDQIETRGKIKGRSWR